jgi:hypothetical protein
LRDCTHEQTGRASPTSPLLGNTHSFRDGPEPKPRTTNSAEFVEVGTLRAMNSRGRDVRVESRVRSAKEFAVKNEQKWLATLVALCVTPLAVLADVPLYTIVELEGLPGATASAAFAVNGQRQIAGFCLIDGYAERAVVWIDGVPHDLGPGRAVAINSSGVVIGDFVAQVFVWDAVSGYRILPIPYDEAYGVAIGDLGQIAGTLFGYEPYEQWAFVCDGSSITTLAPAGAQESNAGAMNSIGHIAGDWWGDEGLGGFLYRDGTMLDVGVFPGWDYGQITGLNDSDVMVGTMYRDEPEWHYRAFKFDLPNDQWIELPTIGESNAWPAGVNSIGQVVGYASESVLWDTDGSLVVLNDLISPELGWDLAGCAINDAGLICGWGMLGGTQRAYLLIPGACAGDIIADGLMDLRDLASFLSAFGSCTGDANFQPLADMNASGCVELDDLGQFLALFGTTCR